MNKILGVIAVILFWVVTLVLSPLILLAGVLFFLLAIFFSISSIIYEMTVDYLKRKRA